MNRDSHLTSNKDFKLENRLYTCSDSCGKPQGLWYQINNSWEEWCKYNMPNWIGPGNRGSHKIDFEIDKTNVLVIQTLEEFDLFHNTYCTPHPFLKSESHINWKKVSETYDGIEISDHFCERRLEEHCSWYYGWDVASGCIWNTDIIKVVGKAIKIKETENIYEQ